MKTLRDHQWQGKTAIIRADLNVPLSDSGGVADDARLTAAAPTVRHIIANGGSAIVLSHLGRPTEGAPTATLSLAAVAPAFSAALQLPVRFCPTIEEAIPSAGEVLLLENTRFNTGEAGNDLALARRYAALGDIFVMDAFASAHRAEASTAAIAETGIPTCAGDLLQTELDMLSRITSGIQRPLVGIFGGAKISTKLALLQRMATLCDTLLIGGGMANTLLLAQGKHVGISLVQQDMIADASAVLAASDGIHLPKDAIVENGDNIVIDNIADSDKILDIGSQTRQRYAELIGGASTIIWNGPLGLFETPAYAAGTTAIARAVAAAGSSGGAYTLIGGADTIAAVRLAGALDHISHVSTGGGALLEYLAGTPLPGIAALAA